MHSSSENAWFGSERSYRYVLLLSLTGIPCLKFPQPIETIQCESSR